MVNNKKKALGFMFEHALLCVLVVIFATFILFYFIFFFLAFLLVSVRFLFLFCFALYSIASLVQGWPPFLSRLFRASFFLFLI